MTGNRYIGQLVIFIVIGTLIGYSPLTAGIIKKTRKESDSFRRYFIKASLLSIAVAVIFVGIYDYFYPLIAWQLIPRNFWYTIGLTFVFIAIIKLISYWLVRDLSRLYNAAWYFLAGLLLTIFEVLYTAGTSGITLTIILLLLAVIARYFYWKELHHHARKNESKSIL